MRIRRLLILLLFAALPLAAAPVTEEEQVPIDLRRTTLIVRDIDRSLEFYRDALGLRVIYDNEIVTPRGASEARAEKISRLVFLRANDNFVGIIGLLQYKKPLRPAAHQGDEPFSTGSTVMVFNAENVTEVYDKAAAVPGVRAISRPKEVSYPSYDGKSTIPVIVSVITDPDGFVIELNQLLSDIQN